MCFIKKLLMENKTLKVLKLGGDDICNAGAITILEGMKHNNTLTSLSVFMCRLSFIQKGTIHANASCVHVHVCLIRGRKRWNT